MNKNAMVGLGIAVITIVGIAVYAYRSPAEDTAQNTQTNATTTTTATTNGNNTSSSGTVVVKNPSTFKSIFSQQGSHVCEFELVGQSSHETDAIYTADGKMRGEFRSTIGAKITSTMMVYNGGTLYTWTEGMGTGTKKQIKTVAELPIAIPVALPPDLTSGAVFGTSQTNVSWDCHDWSKDSAKLSPPTNVKFY